MTMTTLRPECFDSKHAAVPDDTALFLIRDSVFRRRTLIHGRLNGPEGTHCAIGWFWADNPRLALNSDLIDEVAAVNDSVPNATPQQRWKKVSEWLRWKIAVMAAKRKR